MNTKSSNSITYDREYSTDIALFARTLMHGGTAEVRIVTDHGIYCGYFDNAVQLAEVAKKFEAKHRPPAIYIVINPVNPALKARAYSKLVRSRHTAKDTDVPHRFAILFDVDPDKPSGTSSTDAEMFGVLAIRDKIVEELKSEGFKAPILTASGNGAGALYLIDLPNDTHSHKLVSRILAKVKAKHPRVDTSVVNAAQPTKLCGTWVRKGSEVDGRKHRQSGFILPDVLEVTPRDVLEAFAPESTATEHRVTGTHGNLAQRRARERATKVCAKLNCSIADEPTKQLDSGALLYPFTSDSAVCQKHPDGPHAKPGDACLMLYPDGTIEFKCHHDRCQDGKWHEDFEGPSGLGYERSDYGMARRVADYLGPTWRWVEEWSQWVYFDGKRFVPTNVYPALQGPIVDVAKAMIPEMPRPSDAKDKEAMKAYEAWLSFCNRYQNARGLKDVEQLCRGQMACSAEEFDRHNTLLPCENVVLDLQRGKALPHSAGHKVTKLARVIFNPEAKCPRWLQFIDEITCGDRELADYLQRICGYCLSGLVTDEVLVVLHGDGSNGKSVFTKTLLKLLGDYGGTVQQDLLMASPNQHPTQFAYLYGRRCVVAQETDQDCRLNESQVKALTGGDRIQCRRMREDFWDFAPTHKILLATNHVPIIRGTDKGIWRRVRLVPFLATFDGASKDTGLQSKLDAELSGILNWCIEGFSNYLFDGLHEPTAVVNSRTDYQKEMNVVGQFVEECCLIEVGAQETNSDLYQAFKKYCYLNGAYGGKTPSNRKFQLDIVKVPGVSCDRDNGKERTRIKKGIAIKAEYRPSRLDAIPPTSETSETMSEGKPIF